MGLPSLKRLNDFNELGTKKYKWESMCQFLGPLIFKANVEGFYFSRMLFTEERI